MFRWILKPILSEMKGLITKQFLRESLIDLLNDEETQTFLIGFSDSLYERYKAKMLGSIGGNQKGINYALEGQMPSLIDSKGRFSIKNAVNYFLGRANQNKDSESRGLP